jgi:SAM-dependent methyltransferase
MPHLDRRDHWENVYIEKGENRVSWFQESPTPSLELIRKLDLDRDARIIDIGGGASRLVDALIADRYRAVTVLDLSATALSIAKARLADKAARVTWVVADVTAWEPDQSYDLWHDRAAFHFLTEAADRSPMWNGSPRRSGRADMRSSAPSHLTGRSAAAGYRSSATMPQALPTLSENPSRWLQHTGTNTKRHGTPHSAFSSACSGAFERARS